jgi:riboflavin kinase / FMN adenylyltransferase
MTMIKAFENLNIEKSWVTVGSFDGVHLGHQALARYLSDSAHSQGSQAVVVTFSPHPAVFFKRVPEAYSLTSPRERERLLHEAGIDKVVTVEFNQEVANLPAADFMQMIKNSLGLTHLVAGFNFALGRERSGDIPTLKELGKQLGYEVEVIEPQMVNGEVISSSQVRKLLADGELARANQCLGRPYSLEGYVIHGEHRGHHLGFPTANLDIAIDRLLPARGVYASRAIVNGNVFTAVTNIGVRPTFENPLPTPRVEPHLLDQQEDLYGKYLSLELIEFLRPEKAFNSPEDLIAQVKRDIQKTRELLDHAQ